jgi:hypothetical protein
MRLRPCRPPGHQCAPDAPEPLTPEQMFEGGTNVYSNWMTWLWRLLDRR